MRHTLFAAVLVLLAAASLAAQESSPRFEVGLIGSDIQGPDAGSLVVDPFPNGLGLYLDAFLTDRVTLSPSVTGIIWGEDGFVSTQLRTDIRYLFNGAERISPYVFGSGTAEIRSRNAFDPGTDIALGAGVGIRIPVADAFVASVELRYDHWLSTGSSQLGVGLRIGIPLGRR